MSDQALDAVLARLTAKRDRVRRAPAVPDASLDSLFADYALRHAHATTALEGNTLTLHETQEVLESGTTIPGKSLREHLEVVNANAAWLWLRQSINQRTPFTEDTVLELHRRLMQGILGDEAVLGDCWVSTTTVSPTGRAFPRTRADQLNGRCEELGLGDSPSSGSRRHAVVCEQCRQRDQRDRWSPIGQVVKRPYAAEDR